jgi:hypothetical protein
VEGELGKQYARLTVDFMRKNECSPLLGWIAADMDFRNDSKMVAVGFMAEISRLAMFGRRVIDELDRAEAGWTTVVYRKPEDDDAPLLVGTELGIPMPEPMSCIEVRKAV